MKYFYDLLVKWLFIYFINRNSRNPFIIYIQRSFHEFCLNNDAFLRTFNFYCQLHKVIKLILGLDNIKRN